MATDRPYLVLGLDPGIASCGFCLLDMTNHKILEMGSHLFDPPQRPKDKTSLAVKRRNARSIRRNTLRTKTRLKHCMKLFKEAGLVPTDADKTWFQSKKGDKPILKLRANGLDRLLTNREFAQVLYSLCARRGYIPHGEGRLGETDDAEGRKVLDAIKKNSAAMEAGDFRTVGEMLYARGTSRNRSGSYDLCVYNSQIQEEAHALFASQRSLGNPKATEDLEVNYIACLTWEKKSLDHDQRTYELVGNCSYFLNEKRAAEADISSELCRAYERLGHIVIVHEDGSEQTLSARQIDQYLQILFSTTPLKGNKDCKVTYGSMRKDLELSGKDVFKGIAQDAEKNEVFAPKSWRCLRKCLSADHEELLNRMFDDRAFGDDICEALTFASTEGSLEQQLEPLCLSEEELDALLRVPFAGKLFKGYGSRSRKALELLLGFFEEPEVRTLAEAEKASGLLGKRLSDRFPRTELLPPFNTYDPTCRNPVVLRAMGRMRRIVNSIIRIYGIPDEIHIELGRDLKMSNREKNMISKRQRTNEVANRKWASIAAEILGCEPEEVSGRVIRKLVLREEQGEKDAYYINETIDLERLVRDERYCEIDHILPYSRTCDDSRANKVLVLSKSNQDKRERTPYEWMTSGEPGAPSWDEHRARVMATVKQPRKRANLLNTDLGPDAEAKFLARNLNDDRYMSVAVKNYLEECLLFPKDGRKRHVTAVAGGATGNLRWVWGLNFGQSNVKDRSDDRHHAVDAAIIAACSEKTVHAVAKASSLGKETFKQMRKSRLADTQPWPTFASEVAARREFVVPTRMANHGATGRVFEDFSYRLDSIRETGYAEVSRQTNSFTKQRRSTATGNYKIIGNSTVKLIDTMAFIRLWHDRSAGKQGRWYVEPVYYADIPRLNSASYVPKYQKQKVARNIWSPVPAAAMQEPPLLLYRGDVLVVGNKIARYWSFDIGGGKLSMKAISNVESDATGFPSISKWDNDTQVHVLQEDCLGHCYDNMALNIDDSSFQARQ